MGYKTRFCFIYIYPYTHNLERASKENFERETLEKTRLTHPQSLLKRFFKFLYSLPLHCQILKWLITKTFSHHIHSWERVVWCFGKQLGRNQFHIDQCYGQVAESEKIEKKYPIMLNFWYSNFAMLKHTNVIDIALLLCRSI